MIVACRIVVLLLLLSLAYPYTIYPFLLWMLRRLWPRPWSIEPYHPPVSILIAVHNEAAVLRAKLDNTLGLEYPLDRLEVVVASDCSSDATDAIVRSYGDRVRLVRLERRSGKQVALNRAAQASRGEVLVFTDASVYLPAGALSKLTRNLVDPSIGAVSSVIRITCQGANGLACPDEANAKDAEGVYLSFDIATRRLESTVESAVGCCGSCYAVRRACFVPFDEGACNDFVSALDAVRLGYRVVVEPEAVGYMLPAKTVGGEFRRKARTIAGGLDTLFDCRAWPSCKKHPVFWWSLISHKVARWVGPILIVLLGLVCLGGAVAGDRVLLAALLILVLGILLGVVAIAIPPLRQWFPPLRLAGFGLVAWSAALAGWFQFLSGRRQIVWQPTAR